jgi:hypothetical protein
MSEFELPDRGIVFWAVGVGDSTTVVVNDEAILQIDLHHLEAAEEEEDPRVPIVDRLVELLPERDGKPYLATSPPPTSTRTTSSASPSCSTG